MHEYFLLQKKIEDTEPFLSLSALTLASRTEGTRPTWLLEIESQSNEWGVVANIMWVCDALGQTPSYFLNPILNLMNEKGRTFLDATKELFPFDDFNSLRISLVKATWKLVGCESFDEAKKVLGIKD